MVSTFSRRSVTAEAMEWWLAWNSSDLGLILLWSTVIGSYPSVWGRPGLAGCSFRETLRAHPCALDCGHPWPQTLPERTPHQTLVQPCQWIRCRGLLVQEQLATDQHPSDFRRSSPDFIQLRVPQQSAGRVFVDVAVAAQQLDR